TRYSCAFGQGEPPYRGNLPVREDSCYTSRLCGNDGRLAHFLFVVRELTAGLTKVLETTLQSLGYELVAIRGSGKGRLLRVFIDKEGGINVDDCAKVSNNLSRVLAVEGIDYERLEVSSPGLDRLLR